MCVCKIVYVYVCVPVFSESFSFNTLYSNFVITLNYMHIVILI